jgi:hypothetical protein
MTSPSVISPFGPIMAYIGFLNYLENS